MDIEIQKLIGLKPYISGPMSGYVELNYPQFFEASGIVTTMGFCPINPAKLSLDLAVFRQTENLSISDYMRHDLKSLLDSATSLILLPGYEDSAGAILELTVAMAIGIPIFHWAQVSEKKLIEGVKLPK